MHTLNFNGLMGGVIFALFTLNYADAGPITSEARALQPRSTTSSAITGPIIISDSQIIFGNGQSLQLSQNVPDVLGAWDLFNEELSLSQVFDIAGQIDTLLNGNTLCGDEPAGFMAASQEELFGSWSLQLTFFSGAERPEGIHNSGLCGTFTYLLDGPIGNLLPVSDGALPVPNETTSVQPTKWSISSAINPIDDTQTIVLQLTADTGQSSYGVPVAFIARCRSNVTEAYVLWNEYLGDDSSNSLGDSKYVTVRIGSDPATRSSWEVSTDNEATFAPDSPIDFLRKMLDADHMLVQTTPYGESPVTAVFDTSGMDLALRELANVCHWTF